MGDSQQARRIPPIQKAANPPPQLWDRLFGSIPLATLELFCQRMGIGLRAGIDILKILETESRQGSPRHRLVMKEIYSGLRSGETLTTAFRKSDPYFPPLLVQLVSAGETSGGLDRIFGHLSQHYKDLRLAKRQFLGQIAWPLIQLVLAIGIICVVIFFIKPIPEEPWLQKEHFDMLGLGLSGFGGIFIFLSWIAAITIVVGGLVIAIWRNFFNCHKVLIPLVLPIPMLGGVFSNSAMARMSMTLSMLLNSGVDAMRCVREAFLSTGNHFYIQGMSVALECVQRGESLAGSLAKSRVFPQEFIDGVEVGELSGNETESLEYLATEYNRRAKSSMTQLSVLTGVVIWIAILILIALIIIRFMMQYVKMLQSFM